MKYLLSSAARFSFTLPSLADTVVITQNGLDYFPREAQVEVGDTVRGNGPMAPTMWHLEQIARKTVAFMDCSASQVPVFEYVVEESLAGQTVEYHCTVGNHCGFGMFAYLIVGDVNPPCAGDVNGDQAVTFDDVLLLLASWGDIDPDKDVDGSGTGGLQ